MLTSIHIQGFKGFKNTKIDTLKRVNLVVGGQNVGKTSLLEGIRLGILQRHNDLFAKKTVIDQHESSFRTQVNDYEEDHVIISASLSIVLKGSNDIFESGTPTVVSCFLPTTESLAKLFSQLKPKARQQLEAMLKKIDSRLMHMELTAPDNIVYIQVLLKGFDDYLKLSDLGHGFSRLLTIYAELLSYKSNLALIDEIENGIHYSALPTVFEGIKNVAREREVQTIMTTHSWDCIRAACEVFADSPDDFQVIRLERTEDNIRAVCIDGERMQRLMADDREVR